MGETEALTVVTFIEHHGRYRVEFDYTPTALAVLKKTLPGPMRRFMARLNQATERWEPLPGENSKFWEISVDWVGPLASAFINADIEVLGLDHANIANWFEPFSAATPISPSGHRAYRKGLCTTCESTPHRPGGVECDGCHRNRLTTQHRIKAILAETGAMPYPEARPAGGSARTTYYPLEVDRRDVAIVERDHSVVVDILIAAEHDRSPATCPICSRRPPEDTAVHAACRTRLLHALNENQPFTKGRNKAFQDGLCTVCLVRPRQVPGGITCAHCAEIADTCRSLRYVGISTNPGKETP